MGRELQGANAQPRSDNAALHDADAQFHDAGAQLNDAIAQLAREPAAGAQRQRRLRGRDIICFANDWSGDPLSKKHVMRRLARHNRVLWVNSLGNRAPRASARDLGRIVGKLYSFARQLDGKLVEVERNIHVLAPLALPSYRSTLARKINERVVTATVRAAMRRLRFRDPILYTFVPASAWVVGRLGETRVVYHCVDEYAQFAGAGPEIAALEAELIGKSDLVIACSTPLQRRKAGLNPRTVLVRHGVEHEHFAAALDPATEIPAELRVLPRPILGFYGLVAEWVDLAALKKVAQAYAHGSVVIIGEHNNADRNLIVQLHNMPNVHLLGRRPYAALPGYCKAFDVALLPFVKNELTENANPLKLREYLAAGLPVVATDIPEAVAVAERGVHLADSADAFVTRVGEALAAGAGPDRARSLAMKRESWDEKVAQIEQLLMELQP
jgi:glycosyltransferase involved in cell wall biosynthesis